MAKIVYAEILVDDDFDAVNFESLLKDQEAIIDFCVQEKIVNAVIDDSIVNETYVIGDAFSNWIVFRNESDPDSSYWSHEYGWVNFDLATKFDSTAEMPDVAKADGGIFIKF